MRGFFGMLIGAAVLAVGVPSGAEQAKMLPGELRLDHRRGKGRNMRRGRGVQAKPKRRPNMLRIGKLARRRHRRKAA